MRRLTLPAICAGIFGLAMAISANAAGTVATQKTSNTNISTHTVRSDRAARDVWPAETMTGTIMTVDPNLKVVVVRGADQVPFDMRVTRSTRIMSGDKTLRLPDLKADTSHSVSVTFVPTGSGDIARAIRIKS